MLRRSHVFTVFKGVLNFSDNWHGFFETDEQPDLGEPPHLAGSG